MRLPFVTGMRKLAFKALATSVSPKNTSYPALKLAVLEVINFNLKPLSASLISKICAFPIWQQASLPTIKLVKLVLLPIGGTFQAVSRIDLMIVKGSATCRRVMFYLEFVFFNNYFDHLTSKKSSYT